jgi:hypothetical protein
MARTRRHSRWNSRCTLDFEGTVADGNVEGSIDFDGTEDGMDDGVLASDSMEEVKFDGSLNLDSSTAD